MQDDYIDPNEDHDYRGIEDIQKIIMMLENIVIKMGWDAHIGTGAGDSAFGDIRIPSKYVSEFVEFLRSMESDDNCIWTEDEDGIYFTSCDEAHEFINGTPEENRAKFCPYCGKIIKSTSWSEGEMQR